MWRRYCDQSLYIDWVHQLLKELQQTEYNNKPRRSKTIWFDPAYDTPQLSNFIEGINFLELAAKAPSSKLSSPIDWICEAIEAIIALRMRDYWFQHHPEEYQEYLTIVYKPDITLEEKGEAVLMLRKFIDADQYRRILCRKIINEIELVGEK